VRSHTLGPGGKSSRARLLTGLWRRTQAIKRRHFFAIALRAAVGRPTLVPEAGGWLGELATAYSPCACGLASARRWHGRLPLTKAIADGRPILETIGAIAREPASTARFALLPRLRGASWSSHQELWTLQIEDGSSRLTLRSGSFHTCSGYCPYRQTSPRHAPSQQRLCLAPNADFVWFDPRCPARGCKSTRLKPFTKAPVELRSGGEPPTQRKSPPAAKPEAPLP
jgi:hypothetical protein